MAVGRRRGREILFPHRLLRINILSAWERNANLLDCHFEIHNEEKLGIPERMLGADPTEAVVRFTRTQKITLGCQIQISMFYLINGVGQEKKIPTII